MGYGIGGFGGGICGHGYTAPVTAPVGVNPFVLIVVLFILLIIVGAAWC